MPYAEPMHRPIRATLSLLALLTLGLFLLLVLMTDFGRFLQGLFSEGLQFLSQLVEALAPLS